MPEIPVISPVVEIPQSLVLIAPVPTEEMLIFPEFVVDKKEDQRQQSLINLLLQVQ